MRNAARTRGVFFLDVPQRSPWVLFGCSLSVTESDEVVALRRPPVVGATMRLELRPGAERLPPTARRLHPLSATSWRTALVSDKRGLQPSASCHRTRTYL